MREEKDYIFETDRLGFRLWEDKDEVIFARINADPEVMKYFPNTLTRKKSDRFVERIFDHFNRYNYGLWAVELKSTNKFIGYIGFQKATFDSDFTPCVEIGWRLDKKYWNQGYASEGAKACLKYGFKQLGFDQIYSFTSLKNKASIRVMQKAGMELLKEYNHPTIDTGHPLNPHILYTIKRNIYNLYHF